MSASIIIIALSLLGIILINDTDGVGNFRQIEFLVVETFYWFYGAEAN